MQSVLVSLLSCHVLPPCSESRREVQKLSVGMQQILSNITRFLGSYVGILLQLCCNCRVCIEWKVLPPLPVRCGGGNKNWGYKLRRARSMTNCEKAGTGWLGCPIKDAIQCHLYHVYIYISIQQIIQVKAHFRTSMCYQSIWGRHNYITPKHTSLFIYSGLHLHSVILSEEPPGHGDGKIESTLREGFYEESLSCSALFQPFAANQYILIYFGPLGCSKSSHSIHGDPSILSLSCMW